MRFRLLGREVRIKNRDAALAAVAGAIVFFVLPFLAKGALTNEIYSLPVYALLSFNRMALAYAASIAFAVIYGYYAATKKLGEKYLVPILDVLQSVPILGFFPAVLFLFAAITPNQQLGTEFAAIFLIFTSMAWNLAYAVYESYHTIPKDLKRAASVFGFRGPGFFAKIAVPASVPRLVYNSMISWSNAWFFLVASEIISLGSVAHELPGLGSFLVKSAARGDTSAMGIGIIVLVGIVTAMNLLVWRPLSKWSEKYKYDSFPSTRGEPNIWNNLSKRIPFSFNARAKASKTLVAALEFLEHRDAPGLPNRWDKFKRTVKTMAPVIGVILALFALYVASIFYGQLGEVLYKPLPATMEEIVLALAKSFARLSIAFIISLSWTLPLGLYMARNKEAEEALMPFFEVTMSIPGIAFLPAIIVAVLSFSGSPEIIAIGLLLLGMQCYLLFNIVSGAKSLPTELNDAAGEFGVRGIPYYRKILLPAVYPALITGSIAAWGGGWNALVVAEYVVFGNKVISVDGVGSLLNKAIYQSGDVRLVLISVAAIVIPILLLNRFVWKPLYRWTANYSFGG